MRSVAGTRGSRSSQMETHHLSRRNLLKTGSAAMAGLTVLRLAGPASAFPSQQGGVVIPWLDQPAPNPVPEIVGQQLVWEDLDAWLTPVDQFFTVSHYGMPAISEQDWRLEL